MLTFQIDICTEIDDAPDGPSQGHSHNATEHSHDAGLGEKQSLHIAIAGADCFHDPDFAAALENRHDQRVDNPDGGDCESETTENSQEQVENRKKLPQTASCVNDRKGIEP